MRKRNNPLVSVLIAAYNSELYIRESLESIIKQTYRNLEIVVSDDCSSDKTIDIVKTYLRKDKRIKLLTNEKNLGIAGNMNKGILSCNGDFIAILDGDDWAYEDRIERQVEVMKDPQIVLCSGYMDICDEDLNFQTTREYPVTDTKIRKAMVRYDPISHPASMWKREALLKTTLYNDNFPICRDYDLIVRISEFGKYRNVPKPLIKYRVRKESETGKRIRQTQWYSFYIQMKAHFEYKFPLTFSDRLFLLGRLCATIILPTSLQRFIANNFSKIHK